MSKIEYFIMKHIYKIAAILMLVVSISTSWAFYNISEKHVDREVLSRLIDACGPVDRSEVN